MSSREPGLHLLHQGQCSSLWVVIFLGDEPRGRSSPEKHTVELCSCDGAGLRYWWHCQVQVESTGMAQGFGVVTCWFKLMPGMLASHSELGFGSQLLHFPPSLLLHLGKQWKWPKSSGPCTHMGDADKTSGVVLAQA